MSREPGVVPALLAVVCLWGGSYAAVKAAQATLPVLALVGFRAAVGALALLALVLVTRRGLPRVPPRRWPALALASLTGTVGFQLGMVGSLRYTTPSHTALVIMLHPVLAALLARGVLGEELGGRRAAGIGLALAGAAVLVGRDGAGLHGASLAGDLLALGAALAWAGYTVLGKVLLRAFPPLDLSALTLGLGAVPLLGLGFRDLAAVAWRRLDPGTWVLLAYLSLGAIGAGHGLWYWALARTATAQVAVFSYLVPVVAVLVSVGTGQERVTPAVLAGGAAVLGGVVLAHREPAR